MNLIEKIKKFYYEDHLKQKEIAKIVGKTPSYISQVLSKTDKSKEKEQRHQQSLDRKKLIIMSIGKHMRDLAIFLIQKRNMMLLDNL